MREEIHNGDVFGRWTVIDENYIVRNGHRYYLCRCSCEKHTENHIEEYELKSGRSQSCGCLIAESAKARFTTHGKSKKSKLYNVWCSMRERCNCKTNSAYSRYGGRGISIAEEWNDFLVFEKWALENGYKEDAPKGECTLDRIDVNGNYEPNNCRWISLSEQSDNRQNTIWLEHNGKTQTLLQWSKELGLNYKTLSTRYYNGWTTDEILNSAHERKGLYEVEYQGESHTLHYWARKLNMSYATMWRRYTKGYPLDIVFLKGPLRKEADKL